MCIYKNYKKKHDWEILPTYYRNNNGPNIKPSGTPHDMHLELEYSQSIVYIVMLILYFHEHIQITPYKAEVTERKGLQVTSAT